MNPRPKDKHLDMLGALVIVLIIAGILYFGS